MNEVRSRQRGGPSGGAGSASPRRSAGDVAAEEPLYTAALSDLVLSITALTPARVFYDRADDYAGVTAFRVIAAALGFFLLGFAPFLGVFRFAMPHRRGVVAAHSLFSSLGAAVGVPLVAAAFWYGRPAGQPPWAGVFAVLLLASLVAGFAAVRARLVRGVDVETYGGAVAGAGVLAIMARALGDLSSQVLGAHPPGAAVDVLASTGAAGLGGALMYVAAGAAGPRGEARVLGVRVLRVNVLHAALSVGNALLFAAVHTTMYQR